MQSLAFSFEVQCVLPVDSLHQLMQDAADLEFVCSLFKMPHIQNKDLKAEIKSLSRPKTELGWLEVENLDQVHLPGQCELQTAATPKSRVTALRPADV